MRAFLLVVSFVSGLLAQESVAPKGWSVEPESGRLVLKPQDLRRNEQVRIDLYDSVPPQGDLDSWFQSRLQSAAVDEAARLRCKPRQKPNEVSCMVSARTGDHFFHALKTKDGQYRFVTTLLAPNTLGTARHLPGITRVMEAAVANVGKAGSTAIAKSAPSPASTLAPNSRPIEQRAADQFFQIPIEGIYLHLEYGFGVGGMMTSNYEPYIFLQDGTVTDDLDVYPRSTADMQTWRSRKPRAWGRWTRSSSAIAITWNDARRKPETWNKWFNGRPGQQGLQLTGFYRSIGGGGNTALGGDVMIAAWKNFTFSADGMVNSGGGSGGYSGGKDTGVSVSTSSRDVAQRARYHIDGHMIEFEYAGGRRERRWFYLYPDSDKVLGIGSGTFVRK